MKLIPNWKKAHRLWSVRISMLGTAAGILIDALPDVQEYMPKHWYIGVFLASLVARLIAQAESHD